MLQPGINLISKPLKEFLMKYEPEDSKLWEKWNLCLNYVEYYSDRSSSKVLISRLFEFFQAWEKNVSSEVARVKSAELQKALYKHQLGVHELLDAAMAELESQKTQSNDFSKDLKGVMDKIERAKEIVEVKVLQSHMIDMGNELLSTLEKNKQSLETTMVTYRETMESLALELDSYEREASRCSNTGALSQNVFHRDLKAHVRSAHQRGQKLGLILYRINGLDQFVGDSKKAVEKQIQKSFVDLLRGKVRQSDIIYRVEQKYFLVLLPRCSAAFCRKVINDIAMFIKTHTYRLEGRAVRIHAQGTFHLLQKDEKADAFFERANREMLFQQTQNHSIN
ncbi:MAG: hypothetical protein CSA81_04090 [Acidobacteria bacterium]|nr:MAG: hypothetical protein CSA81_04090 [Acidobacteriota bacterium]